MNINNISGVTTQKNFIEINLKHSGMQNISNSMKNISTQSNNSMENVSTKSNDGDNLEISSTAVSKYEFSNRLKEALNNGKEDGEFIKNVSNEYMKIKREIKGENSTELEQESINVLNEALKYVMDWSVDSISDQFDAFFNYSSNMLSSYKMKKEDPLFNKDEFKDNLNSLMNKVVDTLKNLPDDIKENDLNEKINSVLSSANSSGSLEKMGFDDVKKLKSILNKLPGLSSSRDINIAEKNIRDYKKSANELLDSSGLSEEVKNKFKKAVGKNVRACGKVSAYRNVMQNYKDEIEKLMNLYASLSSQYDSLEKDIKKCKKENNLKMIKSLLKMQMNLQKEMDSLKIRIDDMSKGKDGLENNPDSVEGTEEFKKISEAFDE